MVKLEGKERCRQSRTAEVVSTEISAGVPAHLCARTQVQAPKPTFGRSGLGVMPPTALPPPAHH
eukprot:1161821-Pelagomonas_calceolata.AAC.19